MLKAGQEEAETTTAIIRKPGSVGSSGEAEADDVNGLRQKWEVLSENQKTLGKAPNHPLRMSA